MPGGVRFSKPIRTVLLWQFGATAVFVVLGAMLADLHAAVSAAAGGLVSIAACAASAWVAALGEEKSAGGVLVGALRAEAVKLGVAGMLLWLVLKGYEEAVVGAFLAAFVVTMVVFSMAFFVREE